MSHAALGQRVELALPAERPYSYEGDCVSLAWRSSCAASVRSAPRNPCRSGWRSEAARRGRRRAAGTRAGVSGRVIVEEGGARGALGAPGLRGAHRRLPQGHPRRGQPGPRRGRSGRRGRIRLPARAPRGRPGAGRHRACAHRLGGRRRVDRAGPDPRPTGRSSCSRVTLPPTGRGGRVAEGTRLLSEYGDQTHRGFESRPLRPRGRSSARSLDSNLAAMRPCARSSAG